MTEVARPCHHLPGIRPAVGVIFIIKGVRFCRSYGAQNETYIED
nr:MAG TPA: hypothetical protein [Bacteriophage sp.]